MSSPGRRILFVCLGNICRSPTAEGVLRHLLATEAPGLSVEVDSAGTGDYHLGEPPDLRSQRAAKRRGIDLSGLSARQVSRRDFDDFDLILAMDHANLRDLQEIAPPGSGAQIRLLREFDAASADAGDLDVPDPYYGGGDGFEEVLDLVQAACEGLLTEIRAGTIA